MPWFVSYLAVCVLANVSCLGKNKSWLPHCSISLRIKFDKLWNTTTRWPIDSTALVYSLVRVILQKVITKNLIRLMCNFKWTFSVNLSIIDNIITWSSLSLQVWSEHKQGASMAFDRLVKTRKLIAIYTVSRKTRHLFLGLSHFSLRDLVSVRRRWTFCVLYLNTEIFYLSNGC